MGEKNVIYNKGEGNVSPLGKTIPKSVYSLHPKMMVHVPQVWRDLGPLTIAQVVVILTLKIKNINYSETPQSCGIARLLGNESLTRKYLTLSLKFLTRQINQTIIMGPKTIGR